jgi:hypothetical protein
MDVTVESHTRRSLCVLHATDLDSSFSDFHVRPILCNRREEHATCSSSNHVCQCATSATRNPSKARRISQPAAVHVQTRHRLTC